ncbi:hypothetical protein [Paraferrimonas sedimenticola]|uniref:Uncharacterized protein n=1 Tax=Paraferrimonas sedimenticola TaxID=375674 RepID=A0AA37RTA5_9GAMM|nr:hypothetical protein [Paraferrimonas sedimenticola]GLP94941.1 hypothetical protein GCM10007895_02470 [Paraferrimonas sedimenticola]
MKILALIVSLIPLYASSSSCLDTEALAKDLEGNPRFEDSSSVNEWFEVKHANVDGIHVLVFTYPAQLDGAHVENTALILQEEETMDTALVVNVKQEKDLARNLVEAGVYLGRENFNKAWVEISYEGCGNSHLFQLSNFDINWN